MKTPTIRSFTILSFMIKLAPAFFATTYQLFLFEHGLDIFAMSAINAAYMIATFILEIPTGAFADSFGRRASTSVGCLILGLSFLVYFLSAGLMGFILAEIIGALGMTLISGAAEAWAVDALAREGGRPLDLFRQEEKARQAGVIVGSLSGALVGSLDLSLPWLLSGIGMIGAAIIAWRLMPEPGFARKQLSFNLQPLISTAKESWREGRSNPSFLRLTAMSAIFAVSVQSLNMQWTLSFKNGFQLPVWSLGLIFVGISLATALGARFAPLAASKGRHDGQVLSYAFGLAGIAMLLSGLVRNLLPALTFFLLHESGQGLFSPLKKEMINRRVDSHNRATMLSLESMGAHAGAFVGLIGGGWIAESLSISAAWSGSGLLLLVLTPLLWKKSI
ncbi:MAG: MFS transporter [Bacillota bacterium]